MQALSPVSASDLLESVQTTLLKCEVYDGTNWIDLTDMLNPVNTLPTNPDVALTNIISDGSHTISISTDYSIHNSSAGKSVKWVYGSGVANIYYYIPTVGWGSAGTEWSFSVYVRRADGADITPTGLYIYTLGDNRQITSYTKTSVGGGWYRLSASYTFAASAKLWLVGIYGLPSTTVYLDGWVAEPGLGTSDVSVDCLKSMSCSVSGAGDDTEPIAGSWSAQVDNSSGMFNPYHPTSLYKDLIRLGRKARLCWGTMHDGSRVYWQRLTGYMDSPRFDLASNELSISGTDYMKVLADTKLFSPWTYWGTYELFDSVSSPGGTGSEIYAEADACEVGAGEADNVTNWAVGGAGGAVSSEGPAPDSSYYLYFERDGGPWVLEYAHNSNVGSVTAGNSYRVSFQAVKTGEHAALVRVYQTVGGSAVQVGLEYIYPDWRDHEVVVNITSTGALQLRVESYGKYAADGDSVSLDNVSIKLLESSTWNIYEMPAVCNGVYYVELDGEPVWQGDEDGQGGWHYDEGLNALFFSEELVINIGEDNLRVYYFTDTAPEDVIADLLVVGGLYASRSAAKAAMSYTATGVTIGKVWFEAGTPALDAVRLVCERVNYRFWFGADGTPNFKPAPTKTIPVHFDLPALGNIAGLTLYQDIEEVRNHVTIEGCERSVLNVSTGQVERSTWKGSDEDPDSILLYQRKTYSLNNHLFQSQEDVDNAVAARLAYYREPKFYVDMALAYMPVPLEVGDTVGFLVPAGDGTTTSKQGIVRSLDLSDFDTNILLELCVPFDTELVVHDAAMGLLADTVTLDYPGILSVQDATMGLSAEQPALQQVFNYTTTQSGSSLSVPSGATQAVIECWGSGGDGGDGEMVGRAGGGGGGAYSKATVAVSGGQTLLLYLVADSDTYITRSSITLCLAKAGEPGDLTGGGAGGAAASGTGDTKYSGGNGYFYATGYTGGGGGSSAGTASNGNNATSYAGAAAVTNGGPGGDGGARYEDGDAPASGPGGGGGGAGQDLSTDRYGGAGYIGRIRITFS